MTLWWPIFYRLKGCTRFVNWFFWLIWIRRLSIQLKTVLQNSTNIQFRFNSTKMSLGFGPDFGKILNFEVFRIFKTLVQTELLWIHCRHVKIIWNAHSYFWITYICPSNCTNFGRPDKKKTGHKRKAKFLLTSNIITWWMRWPLSQKWQSETSFPSGWFNGGYYWWSWRCLEI